MDYTEIIKESLGTLTINKMRTGLAILGIIIGIGSVIALVSLGQGTQQSIQNQIQSLGANLLTVSPGAERSGAVRGAFGGGTTLTSEDANALASSAEITTIKNVSPEFSRRTQVTTGGKNTNTQIVGVTPIYAEVHKIAVSSGNFISQRDVEGMTKVAVLGPQVVTDLFSEANPIGQTIRINNQTFRIIGITASKGGSGFMNQDDIIFAPLSTVQKQLFGASYLSSIALEAKSSQIMTQAQNEVGYFLLNRHKLSDPTLADFSIMSQQDIINTVSSTTGTFTALLAGIAAISLLVGGIGIMNIMLVTVTERTREIGLRKALGAKKKTIITQFLTEAILLTFTGGVIGIFIGLIISFLLTKITQFPMALSLNSIILAFVVSVAIGVLFGWYPANKASNMEPIEALRYE
ncbi:multidrug ABC transporter substrate-binding protein [Candidatus Shapirobacteria bacterium CG08_land_8_20_14_0_20_39_18]|uniref:Multidrug ABC transporter substrate-binding protein n=1 Tax=Candidatus Shapirobacteria bacterium CG08_land_8_20_14_0_20_39_18 TaxID=1974883 RepID=A0A2M6XDQ3_9BACT|nr:MAG: multidrug ABC transporter substrate-binding protein [Candidatus Shapirobacteria bacterium CG08_land_8_20_14_0_20_39_18]PIY66256.1 MAG: multidrug ABC transporter substrate-binding protein [Candidatus Shapirobacteria bacterium CG_4_10_14_0_8_um_filter_39_15]PJE68276.1 MAG: multidrug ABC transporter substrate-binding protein [Candidatus Shapirobacteria bacterium CG10_big_fil_rev_8_21_14_0_10_38_8]